MTQRQTSYQCSPQLALFSSVPPAQHVYVTHSRVRDSHSDDSPVSWSLNLQHGKTVAVKLKVPHAYFNQDQVLQEINFLLIESLH